MVTLAELILERDKERGRRRSRSTTPRTSDAVAAQNQPAHSTIDKGKPAFWSSAALLLLGVAQDYAFVVAPCIRPKIRASNVPIIC